MLNSWNLVLQESIVTVPKESKVLFIIPKDRLDKRCTCIQFVATADYILYDPK
jgi:hypothetical protein